MSIRLREAPTGEGSTLLGSESFERAVAGVRRRPRSIDALLRCALRRPSVLAWAAGAFLTLIAWMDSRFELLTGVHVLYILPIWLLTRLCGSAVGLVGALVVSGLMVAVDLSRPGADATMAVLEGMSWLLSLAVMTLIIARLESKLRNAWVQATRDPLTGALNRGEMQARIEQAIERFGFGGPELALAFVDCDHLKVINDTLGHAFGDRALRVLAAGLRSAVQNQGVVGRIGGDEFVVLFEGLPEMLARERMERAAQRFSLDMKRLGHHATLSYGLVPVGEAPMTFRSLLEAADRRMYTHKRTSPPLELRRILQAE